MPTVDESPKPSPMDYILGKPTPPEAVPYSGPIDAGMKFQWNGVDPALPIRVIRSGNNQVVAAPLEGANMIGLELLWKDEGRFREACYLLK